MSKNNMYKEGFSLVTLLIAMMVIAFGFSLVMPHLTKYANISSTNEQESTPVRQTYSAQKQSTKVQIQSAFLLILNSNGGSIKGLCDTDKCYKELFKHHLNTIKQTETSLTLPNGTVIKFKNSNAECKNNTCTTINIDVNGLKKPNKEGHDIFELELMPNSIK